MCEQSSLHAYFTQMREIYGDEIVLSRPIDEIKRSSVAAVLPAADWDSLKSEGLACVNCALCRTRKQVVWGEGNPKASLMVIGEAPGADEDDRGEPCVGAAGELLTQILDAIGFRREDVFITNILKCPPQNNRDPQPVEIEACMPWLTAQIALIDPAIILALGHIAGQALLQTDQALGQLRGKIHDFQGRKLMVTYHPAALLRNQQWKHPTWADVQKLRALYDRIVGDKGLWKRQKAK